MKIKGIIIVLLCFSILCCNDRRRPDPPERLIEKHKMANILYDMFVVSSAKGANKKVIELNGVVPETYVLNKHKIDSTQFAESNAYYAQDIEEYQSILDEVKTKLNVEKAKYDSILKKEEALKKKKSDSFREARAKDKGKLEPKPKLKKRKDSIKN